MITTAYIHTYIHTFVVIDQHPSRWVQELWERERDQREINTHHVGFKEFERHKHRQTQRVLGYSSMQKQLWIGVPSLSLDRWICKWKCGQSILAWKWKESDAHSEKKWNSCGEKMVAGRGGGSSCVYTYLRRWTAQRSSFWTARLRRGATDMPSRPVVADMPKQNLETFPKPPCASSWAFSRACLLACWDFFNATP